MSLALTSDSCQEKIDPQIERWTRFVENYHKKHGNHLEPFLPVQTLVQKYLSQSESKRPILDIGCETGKNAICLIRAGHKVTLLDIAPKAIDLTLENLKAFDLTGGVAETIIGKIEDLDEKQGPFKAVVGTYTFSFIPPILFQEVMRTNVLSRIEPGGFFAGGFFGTKHVWANNPDLSITTQEKIKELFASMDFTICEMDEKKEEITTILDGQQIFHTIEVIAKRNLNPISRT